MMNGFGKPKYGGGGGNFTKTIRLKENTATVVRILPPMKSLAETGEWAKYIGTHFGYKGVNQKDPSKPTYRTFKCIEEKNFQTKMITQDCPECDLIAQREEELENLKAQAKAQGHSADEIDELTKPHRDWLKDHNCDRKWHMNVLTSTGEFGVLNISHKTKKLLEQKILSLQTDDGIDALDLEQGVWFVFKRTGRGVETQDTVDVEYESVRDAATGRVSRTVKLAPLSAAEAERALKECPDLSQNVRMISHAQIKLLTTCSGEPEDVDAILAMGQKKEQSGGRSAPAASTPKAAAPAPSAPKTELAKPAAPKAPEPVAGDLDDEEAALMAKMEAIKAKKAAAAAAAAPAAPAVETKAPAEVAPTPPTPAAAPAEATSGVVDRSAFMARFKTGKPAA